MKKYALTNVVIKAIGKTLYRIIALKNFGDVKAGDLGGFVESEDNLSHEGDCWVFGEAQIYGNARVSGNARISENAQVYGEALISGDAKIWGNAKVYEKVQISGKVRVWGEAKVCGNTWVLRECAKAEAKVGLEDRMAALEAKVNKILEVLRWCS